MIGGPDALAEDVVHDVCIAGSGPAGLSLASELARRGHRVLVLEGGDAEYLDVSQDIYIGEVIGNAYPPLEVLRLRQLGGSSNHWEGWCRPLDAVDFQKKSYAPDTEWPITRADLDPYLDAAAEILAVPSAFDDGSPAHGMRQIILSQSDPIPRFGEKYRSEIERSDHLQLVLRANLTGVETDGRRITGFNIEDFEGNRRRVHAAHYVLACGGIENSRLLLHFNRQTGGRLINDATTLGRYWMEHPHFHVGDVVLSGPEAQMLHFAPTPEAMNSLEVLNCRLTMWPLRRDGGRGLVRSLACEAPGAVTWATRRIFGDVQCTNRLLAAWEQEPRFENRVALSETRSDMFGIPKSELHWHKSDLDRHTVRQNTLQFGEFLARSGLGRLRVDSWLLDNEEYPDDWIAGNHHMGGTRMSEAPKSGVVDRDLRVWGQENLHIAGSSVFPSGGHANPTLTIVQLSLRLADALDRALKS